jgi:hypothetical protein
VISGGAGAPLYATACGGNFHHYAAVSVASNQLNITAVGLDGLVKAEYSVPLEGPIEIFLREVYNNSQQKAGDVMKIYFSEVPVTQYFSWDGAANSTQLTGLPVVNGLHTLDVYAENDESVWSHKSYAFTTVLGVNPTTTTTTTTTATSTTTPTENGGFNTLIFVTAGIALVALVIFKIVLSKRGRV